jgi:APA family basic amino acid/polyamine antiporter
LTGAAACLFVMVGLPGDTWIRLWVWLGIGFVVYFGYGRGHSRLGHLVAAESSPNPVDPA